MCNFSIIVWFCCQHFNRDIIRLTIVMGVEKTVVNKTLLFMKFMKLDNLNIYRYLFSFGGNKMSDQQLQLLVEKLSLEYFNEPFRHQAYFNNRLRTTGGRYLLGNHNIEFNKKSYDKFGTKELHGIILHELCHYHLHIQGKGYKHRDSDFRTLLKKVGAPRFCSTIEERTEKHQHITIHLYECVKCKQQYPRKRRMNVMKYRCSKCLGALQKVEEYELK